MDFKLVQQLIRAQKDYGYELKHWKVKIPNTRT